MKVEAELVACSVCDEHVDGRALDIHLGPVCLSCKMRLRWAHHWLGKFDMGECTTIYPTLG